jgi:hypothetical protein
MAAPDVFQKLHGDETVNWVLEMNIAKNILIIYKGYPVSSTYVNM